MICTYSVLLSLKRKNPAGSIRTLVSRFVFRWSRTHEQPMAPRGAAPLLLHSFINPLDSHSPTMPRGTGRAVPLPVRHTNGSRNLLTLCVYIIYLYINRYIRKKGKSWDEPKKEKTGPWDVKGTEQTVRWWSCRSSEPHRAGVGMSQRPTKRKLLERIYTENICIENAGHVKRATGRHSDHVLVVGGVVVVTVNKHPVGRPAGRRAGGRHPATLQCLSLVSLRSLWWGFCLFGLLYSLAGPGGSVTHLLGDLVRVEDARDGHLDLVFLFLGLTERRLPLLQEQVGGVLARKLLEQADVVLALRKSTARLKPSVILHQGTQPTDDAL